jgi:hypothetical protein
MSLWWVAILVVAATSVSAISGDDMRAYDALEKFSERRREFERLNEANQLARQQRREVLKQKVTEIEARLDDMPPQDEMNALFKARNDAMEAELKLTVEEHTTELAMIERVNEARDKSLMALHIAQLSHAKELDRQRQAQEEINKHLHAKSS